MKHVLILDNKKQFWIRTQKWASETNLEALKKDGGRLATDKEIEQFLEQNSHIEDTFIRAKVDKGTKPKTKETKPEPDKVGDS